MAKKKLYSFNDHPEHKKRLPEIRDKWIANAMSVAAMTEEDRNICREAVKNLYRAANLEPPPDHRIVFVPSPLTAQFAAGFAAWIWSRKQGPATNAATSAATEAADRLNNWYVFGDMVALAHQLGVGLPGLESARLAYRYWQGGNQWSALASYLNFFKDVAALPIDWAKWESYETLALHSGPRLLHEKFCIISDRPEILLVDEQNRPHCETGPFCKWRDGAALYSWHGTRVPARWIEQRASLDPKEVIAHENVEMRAAGAAIVGWARMLSVLNARVINDSGSPDIGQLIELDLPGLSQPGRFLKAQCPRNGLIVEGLPRVDDFGLPIETALHGQAWRIGLPPSEYRHPEVRT